MKITKEQEKKCTECNDCEFNGDLRACIKQAEMESSGKEKFGEG